MDVQRARISIVAAVAHTQRTAEQVPRTVRAIVAGVAVFSALAEPGRLADWLAGLFGAAGSLAYLVGFARAADISVQRFVWILVAVRCLGTHITIFTHLAVMAGPAE